jgi:hypothetical protein
MAYDDESQSKTRYRIQAEVTQSLLVNQEPKINGSNTAQEINSEDMEVEK